MHQHLTSVEIARQFGLEESLSDLITARNWLGYAARMDETRECCLDGFNSKNLPMVPKMRWRYEYGRI
jgi:hypothetical protein